MDRGFERIDADIRDLKSELREFRAETNARLDSLQRTMIIGFASISASVIASVIGAVVAIQL